MERCAGLTQFARVLETGPLGQFLLKRSPLHKVTFFNQERFCEDDL